MSDCTSSSSKLLQCRSDCVSHFLCLRSIS
jgi:hypothetical protein